VNSADRANVVLCVDGRGLMCPMPLLRAKQALALVMPGQCIEVRATDQGSLRDFHAFVDLTAHHMLDVCEEHGVYVYIIQKAE